MEESVLTLCMASMLLLAMVCTVVFKKLKMPAIVGYLAAGIILANYFTGYDESNTHIIVKLLSDLGLALLMFCIGMELNLSKLKKSGSFAMLVVLIQIPLFIVIGLIFGSMMGWDFVLSICIGAIFAGSSTAVILVVQNERKVLAKEDVDTMMLILVVEDVAQVVMLAILTPMMMSGSMEITDILILVAKIVVFMVVATLVGIKFVPRVVDWIGDHMNREILMISALAFCFILAYLSVEIGLSMAVGAFLMGVIVSQSRFCEDINHDIEPMKEVFMAMFFISIGLEVHPQSLIDNIPLIIAIFALFVVARFGAIFLGYFLGNKDLRIGFISASSMVTLGEFAFIISALAYSNGVMDDNVHAAIIGAALISMVTQSFFTGVSGRIYDNLSARLPSPLRRLGHYLVVGRDSLYEKLNVVSTRSLGLMKKLITFAYFSGFSVILIVIVFYYFDSQIVDFLVSNTEFMTAEEWAFVVRLSEFLLLLVPLSIMVSNLKSAYNAIVCPDSDMSLVICETRNEYLRRSMSVNLWVYTFIADFLLLLIIPSQMDFMHQVLIAVVGIAIFATISVIQYRRAARKDLCQDQ